MSTEEIIIVILMLFGTFCMGYGLGFFALDKLHQKWHAHVYAEIARIKAMQSKLKKLVDEDDEKKRKIKIYEKITKVDPEIHDVESANEEKADELIE